MKSGIELIAAEIDRLNRRRNPDQPDPEELCDWCKTPMAIGLDSVGKPYRFCKTSHLHMHGITEFDTAPIERPTPRTETTAEYKEAQDFEKSALVVPLADFQQIERELAEKAEDNSRLAGMALDAKRELAEARQQSDRLKLRLDTANDQVETLNTALATVGEQRDRLVEDMRKIVGDRGEASPVNLYEAQGLAYESLAALKRTTPNPPPCDNCGAPAVLVGIHPDAGKVYTCDMCWQNQGMKDLKPWDHWRKPQQPTP
jgi:hypothetical protein